MSIALLCVSSYIYNNLNMIYVPISWFFTACAFTFMFNIGFDCVHNVYTNSTILNTIIGEISFLPFLHPFECFKFKHNENKEFTKNTRVYKPTLKRVNSITNTSHIDNSYGTNFPDPIQYPISLLASFGLKKWIREYFDPFTFPKEQRIKILRSIFISLTWLIYLIQYTIKIQNIFYLLNTWLIPLVIYKDLIYPAWLEYAKYGLNTYIPRSIAFKIPTYNLRYFASGIKDYLYPKKTSSSTDNIENNTTSSDDENQWNKHSAPVLSKEEQELLSGTGLSTLNKNDINENTFMSYFKRINWVHFILLLGEPILGLYGYLTTTCSKEIFYLAVIYYFITGIGITAGYHRLWAHRAYKASFPVRFILMLAGTGALEGSIKWWAGGHRVHHRYTDTKLDPYNIGGGFWYAHIGWMLVHPHKQYRVKANIRDLNADPMLRFQHRYFALLGPFMAFIFPALIAKYLFNDFRAGFFYAGVIRLCFVHHSTFCVNSLAHYLGETTYDDERSPRDSIITALVTMGEGYHNFHHEFPNDYRNGIRWYHYDPTKWLIRFCAIFGLTYNLRKFPENEIQKGKLNMMQKKLKSYEDKIRKPIPTSLLKEYTWDEIKTACTVDREALLVVNNLVYDVQHFLPEHPGSEMLLRSAIGKDATKRFNGDTGVYKHSRAARNLLESFRVGKLAKKDQVVH